MCSVVIFSLLAGCCAYAHQNWVQLAFRHLYVSTLLTYAVPSQVKSSHVVFNNSVSRTIVTIMTNRKKHNMYTNTIKIHIIKVHKLTVYCIQSKHYKI